MSTQPKEVIKMPCIKCNRLLATDRNFYTDLDTPEHSKYNHEVFHGRIPFCKDCIKDKFAEFYRRSGDLKTSIIAVCDYINMNYNSSSIPAYDEEDIKTIEDALSIFGVFTRTNTSIGKKIRELDYFDIFPYIAQSTHTKKDDDKLFYEDDIDLEIDSEVVRFFGGGYTERQYKLFLVEYIELVRNFGSDDYDKITYFKDISYLNVMISEGKAQGKGQDEIMKLIEKRNKIMTAAGLNKEQQEGNNSQLFIGKMIKKMENSRPAAEDEWTDNQIEEITTIMAGHLMKVEGKEGRIRDKYEKLMAKYTVEGLESDLDEGDENG